MATVNQSIQVITSNSITPANLPGNVPYTFPENFKLNLSPGTTADSANLIYSATIAFTAAPQVLDLTALTDPTGGAVNFARVRSIWIKVKSTTDGTTLKLGYGATTTNAWTSLVSNPGQIFLQASTANNDSMFVLSAPNTTGWAVSSTNKLLQLDPGAATFSADITIVGANV